MTRTEGPPPDDRVERFRALYDANHADIVGYCRRRADADLASDAVSEVFLTAWRRLDDVPLGSDARLWLFTTARHVLANARRSEQRRDRLHLRLVSEPMPAPVDGPDASSVEPVLRALATLSDDDQEVLRLVTWESLAHAEVATVLGCSVNAVAIRVHRARARLAAALADENSEVRPKGRAPIRHVPHVAPTTNESEPRP